MQARVLQCHLLVLINFSKSQNTRIDICTFSMWALCCSIITTANINSGYFKMHCYERLMRQMILLLFTWHGEVLSVYDLILSIIKLIVILLRVTVQILQIGHHSHAAPRVPALCAGWDGHWTLRWRVFLAYPAKNCHFENKYVEAIQ